MTLILLNRSLGADLLAALIVIVTYTLVLRNLVGVQSWQALTKRGIELHANGQDARLGSLLKTFFMLDVGSHGIAAVVGMMLAAPVAGWLGWTEPIAGWLGVYCVTLLYGWQSVPLSVFRIFGAQRALGVSYGLAPLLQFIVVLSLWPLDVDLGWYLVAWMIIAGVETAVLFVLGQRVLRGHEGSGWIWAKARLRGQGLRLAFWTNAASSLDVIVKQLDTLIVSVVVSMQAVVAYRMLKQVASLVSRVADPLYQTAFPKLIALAAADRVGAYRMALSYGVNFLWIGAVAFALLGGTAWIWLDLALGSEYAQYAGAVSLYLFGLTVSLVFLPVHPLTIGFGRAREATIFLLVSHAAYLFAVVELGDRWGLVGVSAGYLAAVLIVTGSRLYLVARQPEADRHE